MIHRSGSLPSRTLLVSALLVGSLFGPFADVARAEDGGRITLFGHYYSLIVGAAVFQPRQATTRSIYGERAFTPSVALWSFDTPRGLGISWDLGGRRMQNQGRRAQFAQAGVGPRWLFADDHADVAPYLTLRADACAVQIEHGDWRLRPGADLELGASVLRHFVISGRYDAIPKVGGFDLSGFSARAAVKIF